MTKKFSLSLFTFLISPFVSAPLVLKGVYNREKGSWLLFALLIGFLSYNYIPSFTDDKTYYLENYEMFQYLSQTEFLIFLALDRTDFLLHLIFYLFAKTPMPFEFVTMLVSTLTIGIWLYIFFKIIEKTQINKYYSFLWFLVLLFSFSLGDYLSGMRYYLSCSLVLLGFYSGLLDEKKKRGLIFLLLATFTHFSCMAFLPMYLLLKYKPQSHKLYLNLFYVTLIFVFIPKTALLGIFQNLHLPAIIEYKINAYLAPEDYLDRSIAQGNFNNYIVIFFDKLWIYAAIPYIIFTRKKQSAIRNVFLLSMVLVNIVSNAPIVHFRYSILAQATWIFAMAYEFEYSRRYFLLLRFLIVFYFMNLSLDLLTYRENFVKSYFNFQNVSLITSVTKAPMKSGDL